MARSSRRKSSTGIYHVVMRGINQQHIFEDDSDYEMFVRILTEVKEVSGIEVYAYCLMSNHYHILMKEGTEPLSITFRRIGARYVYQYNKKYDRTGHLFQDRYKSEPVETDEYIVTVLKYICQNPVKAGLCKRAAAYKWSSRKDIGKSSLLVDNIRLEQIISVTELLKIIDEPTTIEILSAGNPGRKPRISEDEACRFLEERTGAGNVSAFQRLAEEDQRKAVQEMRAHHISIRQAARITGLSKGIIERWTRKSE